MFVYVPSDVAEIIDSQSAMSERPPVRIQILTIPEILKQIEIGPAGVQGTRRSSLRKNLTQLSLQGYRVKGNAWQPLKVLPFSDLQGIVQRILRGVNTKLK